MPKYLMCPPDYYGIEYEINPWMRVEQPADHDLAVRQWSDLYRALLSLSGVDIELVKPGKDLPDMVFTANAGLVYKRLFVPSRFRHPQRRNETPHYKKWFTEHGFEVQEIPEGIEFEGAGDVLKAGETWIGGYYYRSDSRAHAAVSDIMKEPILPLRLVDPRFYHLDTCFCPIGDSAIYYPGAFDSYSLAVLKDRFPDAIEVESEEAELFACNAVVIDRRVVMNTLSPKLCRALSERGYECHPVGLSEFIKSGGSAKCLTLRLDTF